MAESNNDPTINYFLRGNFPDSYDTNTRLDKMPGHPLEHQVPNDIIADDVRDNLPECLQYPFPIDAHPTMHQPLALHSIRLASRP